MKHGYFLLIVVILFTSCSITKRRYLPGFNMEWSHNSPGVILKNSSVLSHPKKIGLTKHIVDSGIHSINKDFIENGVVGPNLKKPEFIGLKNQISNHVARNFIEPELSLKNTTVYFPDTNTKEVDKVVCKQARASLILGLVGLTTAFFGVAVGLGLIILKNTGGYWATLNLTVPVILGGAAIGAVLGILAIIFAISAYHKIHNERYKYYGKKKAAGGIIMAVILFLLIAFFATQY
jgi:hypothetical protein